MIIQPYKTRIFKENENLIAFIKTYLPKLKEKSIIVVTSKIVALSEGETAPNTGRKSKIALIKKESEWALQTRYTWLTIKDGMIMSSAGIDESNGNGKFILLPRNSFASAEKIRSALKKIYGVKKLGVIITDSRLLPFRAGVVGMAIGYAGIRGVRDYRGTPDIFGRAFKRSRTDVADSLATAAVLEMGEGRERKPLALITDATVEFVERTRTAGLKIDILDDMYGPVFRRLKPRRRKNF